MPPNYNIDDVSKLNLDNEETRDILHVFKCGNEDCTALELDENLQD